MLIVRDLRTSFRTESGVVQAVDGVSFRIPRGRTFALVGESGCGKSVTAYSILKLLPYPPAFHPSGRIELTGLPLLDVSPAGDRRARPKDRGLDERAMREIRGRRISMIFQEPMTSLNPVYTCGSQIVEAIRLHRGVASRAAKARAVEMLSLVGIPDPQRRFGEYPHQMSGGMRQRVMIAMALACEAELLIADEPTTALDVTIQAQILDLLNRLQRQRQLGIMLITHDLAVVAETAHDVAVMYASRLAEIAPAPELFEHPLHPYTQGLFRSIPRLTEQKARLDTIPGTVPNPLAFPGGCHFHPRCSLTRKRAAEADASETFEMFAQGESLRVLKRCAEQHPPLRELRPGHGCACWEAPGYGNAADMDSANPSPSAAVSCANTQET